MVLQGLINTKYFGGNFIGHHVDLRVRSGTAARMAVREELHESERAFWNGVSAAESEIS